MTPNALITGWGMYAPSRVMTNDDLSKLVDTSDEWIVSRTGIRERRIAADDETTSTLERERRPRRARRGGHGRVRARPRDRRHLLARLLHAGHRGARRPSARGNAGRRLRPHGRLLGLRLLARDRHRLRPQRHVPQRAGHRRRAAEPVPRLHRPQHVRPVRRRRRRRDRVGLRCARRPDGPRHVQRRQRRRGDHLPGRRVGLPDHAARPWPREVTSCTWPARRSTSTRPGSWPSRPRRRCATRA